MIYLLRISFLSLFVFISGCNDDAFVDLPEIQTQIPDQPTEIVGDIVISTVSETDLFVLGKYDGVDGALEDTAFSNQQSMFLDKSGILQNDQGQYLMLFPAESNELPISTHPSVSYPMVLSEGTPVPTSQVQISFNLDAETSVIQEDFVGQFQNDCNALGYYNSGFSTDVNDENGNLSTLSLYFVKENEESNSWQMHAAVGCELLVAVNGNIIDFNEDGELDLEDEDQDGVLTVHEASIEYLPIFLADYGTELSLTITLDKQDTSSFATPFEAKHISNNGVAINSPTGLHVHENGAIYAKYVSGDQKLLGLIALAQFSSPANLIYDGNNIWQQSDASGTAVFGVANTENHGAFEAVFLDF